MTRGYFAIGIEAGKAPDNLGGLWRSAHAFGAAYIFTIGARYPRQRCDTTRAWRHVPLMEFDSLSAFMDASPRDCKLVAVECGKGQPRPLFRFTHPERVIYLLGAEDRGLSDAAVDASDHLIAIPATYCLNVATAGSIVMYDRQAKEEP